MALLKNVFIFWLIFGVGLSRSLTNNDGPRSSLMDLAASPKKKTTEGEGEGDGARSLAHNTSGVEGCAGAPGWD
jgi:hypothetical protein